MTTKNLQTRRYGKAWPEWAREEDLREFREMWMARKSCREIGERFGFSHASARNYALRLGICNGPMGCGCWASCACGWIYPQGGQCENPIHKISDAAKKAKKARKR